uniref:MBD domain-containing protein n=1 Tax=Photinus pyralis TaxID=7054 RepID=A0A1Y1N4D0_PHOPY
MAGKPELSAATGVQNVVVYVSDANFGQTYAVGQQNVSPFNTQTSHNATVAYTNSSHSLAPVEGTTKTFPEKIRLLKPYTLNGQFVNESEGYFSNNTPPVISENGFPQTCATNIINNITEFQNVNVNNGTVLNQSNFTSTSIKNLVNYGGNSSEISTEKTPAPGRLEVRVREECDIREGYSSADSGYVSVMGGDGPCQSVRCDSVRSETAESSCSSLSSADEGLFVIQPQRSEMVVYDGNVSVRPGGVVLAVGSPDTPQVQSSNIPLVRTVPGPPPLYVTVPYGWKRILNNGVVIYISPNNTALSSLDQVKEYLLTPGTCKCGLECPLKYDTAFNFDPKVFGKPWTLSQDTSSMDLNKLCNHKRKIISMLSLGHKQSDPIKFRKDISTKRKKRRIGSPYSGVSVSQLLAQRDKLALSHPVLCKGNNLGFPNQVWPNVPGNNAQQVHNREFPDGIPNQIPQGSNLQFYRYQNQEASVNRVLMDPQASGDSMHLQTSSNPNISRHQQHSTPPSLFHAVPNYMKQCDVPNPSQIQLHQQHIVGANGQIISLQNPVYPNVSHLNNGGGGSMGNNPNGIIIHDPTVITNQEQHQKLFVNSPSIESSGPGRPSMQALPIVQPAPQKQDGNRLQQQAFCSESFHYQGVMQHFDGNKNVRPSFVPGNCTVKPDPQYNPIVQQSNQMTIQNASAPILVHQKEKALWQSRPQNSISNSVHINQSSLSPQVKSQTGNAEERVPPIYQHTPSVSVWSDDIARKKVKVSKNIKKRQFENSRVVQVESSCSNVDTRQQANESERTAISEESPQSTPNSSSPSFMEDPSGYLAQQTALLNSTISRQMGMNSCGNFMCSSPVTSVQNTQVQHLSSSEVNEVPLPSNIYVSQVKQNSNKFNQNVPDPNNTKMLHISQNSVPQQYNQTIMAKGPADSTDHIQCQVCIADTAHYQQQKVVDPSNPYLTKEYFQGNRVFDQGRSNANNPTSSNVLDDPVTSSTYIDKQPSDGDSPDSRPIQGGTISTSNISSSDCSQSEPSTPNPHTPTTPQPIFSDTPHHNVTSMANVQQSCPVEVTFPSSYNNPSRPSEYVNPHQQSMAVSRIGNLGLSHPGVITTMASGRTVSCNTITSVLAGRANTSTVSVNSPVNIPMSTVPSVFTNQDSLTMSSINVPSQPITKSPLEMVQSVVSSIQVPQSHNTSAGSIQQHNQQISPLQIIKHSPTQGLPPGHILVSSGGQLIMASSSSGPNVMPPPLPKIVTNQNSMPPISVSPMVTNVTASVTQVIPAVAQQVLGQQTVLVNALPAPFMLQPGVTMTMDGMAVAPNVQIPHLVAGNVIQPQLQVDGSDPNRVLTRTTAILSPDAKKKGKKRKMPSQTIASMLQYASQQNSGVVMSQPSFPQQIQMAHSPQGLTSGPVMQALTIVPGKTGAPTQIVMNGQTVGNTSQFGPQQLITNSNQTPQINLLQPVNLINSTTGMVQNFPTIQQFIVPNLGGMVMNADGTATILPDTSNLGMHLQIQNVNGQNVLTPVQNNNVFGGGQGILAAGPAGMVIRTPNASQGKIIQQQHSPGAQFLSPNGNQFVVNGAQFSGQLSPLITNVNPAQVTFSAAPQAIRPNGAVQQNQPEFIQCGQVGQTLVVPAGNITVSTANQQNTTFVQQNTTIVQQQTTMVSNNQHLQNMQASNQNNPNVASRTTTLNVDQNLILNANDNRSLQAVLMQGQNAQLSSASYRHSVSTQTAVNQNNQAVTTNTFCQTSASAGSPPDTTTLSPLAQDVHRPPTADTTTHMENNEDGLSPTPSCIDINVLQAGSNSCSVAMVDCISSSEPDSADNREHSWPQVHPQPKLEFTEVSSGEDELQLHTTRKSNSPIHIEYPESSTMGSEIHYTKEHINLQESTVSSKNADKMSHKQKHANIGIVPESRHIYLSLFQDEKEIANYPPT